MARPATPNGLPSLCSSKGIALDELLAAIDGDIKRRTLEEWVHSKPSALRVLIAGTAALLKEERSLWLITNTAGWGRYIPAAELTNFLTRELGENWKISDEAVYDMDDNRIFSIKNVGENPVIIL